LRSTQSIEILCLLLAALVLVWSGTLVAQPWAVVPVLAFAAAIATFRARRFFPGLTRTRLSIESWSMVAFVILSALTLGRLVTLLQVGVIALCHLGLASASPHIDILSLGYASQVVGQIAPFLLVAFLTTTLSADITEARERIENLAQTDALTGLYNPRTFNQIWQREHASCEGGRGTYSLLMIDIDRLKNINETFGHDAGNSAITLVAECLQRSIRASDTAARLGGDEFGVLLPGATPEMADSVVKRVRHNVYKTTLDLRSRMIRCTVSVGVVCYPKDGRDVRELMSAVEDKVHRDKELRRAPGAESNA